MSEIIQIPNGWKKVNVEIVCTEMISGSGFPKEFQGSVSGNFPFAKVSDISKVFRAKQKCMDTANHFITEEIRQKIKAKIFPKGTIVFPKIGEALRGNYRVITSKKMLFDNNVMGLVPNIKLISGDFFYYFLSTQDFGKFAVATAIPSIRRGDIGDIAFHLPPLAEQHRIVAKIEELFSELDKGVDNLKTARAQLKVYRQALLKHAFEGKLTAQWRTSNEKKQFPWKEKNLGSLLDFLTSGSRGWAQYYAESGDTFIRAQNIKTDSLDLNDIAFVSLPNRAEGLRSRIQIGDLLITVTGANVTKSALIEHDIGVAYVSQHVALCRPTQEIIPKFLYWFIVAETAGRKQLTDAAYGAGKPGLNLENIRSVIIYLPTQAEQKIIVELIEEKLLVIDQLEQTITTALQQAEALRQSILKKAFSGQLVPQDPDDEPAAALLARIKADKLLQEQASKKPLAKGKRHA